MPKTYTIKAEQAAEIAAIRKTVKNKKVDKRLHAVQLRGEGMKNPEIAVKLDTVTRVVSQWVSDYCRNGIDALLGRKQSGNRRNMSLAEEQAFLSAYKEQAQQGNIIEVAEMKRAYEEKVGHRISSGQIYRVLARQGWRKVMPRSKHPNKASDEEISSSKKLTERSSTRWEYLPDQAKSG